MVELKLMTGINLFQQERKILIKRIKDGQVASTKKCGRPNGTLDKMSRELETDIKKYLSYRNIKQIYLMNKHHISRNTLKKYIAIVNGTNI